ncbi:MAG: methyltransferase domain-containing protein [Proteobacteria bacterium]|nr:methyltransferase domain-containing protein [Pseudomonadota bacterium]MCP4915820.1 methyltransferase domain-containing protein [Pseudomonadota bacterium]
MESKRDLVEAIGACSELTSLHLIAHSGMYGPMFGTTELPEQFSPHEWRTLAIPFAPGAEAFFHSCRSGRWFAPFFARTFGVPASGHHWYTTVSRHPTRYRWVPPNLAADADVFVVGQPGRKSHGLTGALGKHLGWLPPVPLDRYLPQDGLDAPAYDRVAKLYDAVFQDIRVRGPEWDWLSARVPSDARVLDIGCGTGALLRALRPGLRHGAGVDVSGAMLAEAARHEPDARWDRIEGPVLPQDDDRFDVVTSLLSWRYLDWDPLLAEIARVLRPGGRLLVVDMVASPASVSDLPAVAAAKLREVRRARRFPGFVQARKRLVADPAWAAMLQYNPIRAEHEYRWFFGSRFPAGEIDVLDVGRNSRVLGVDSGPIADSWFPPQSYP